VTRSITFFGIVARTYCPEGRERSVQRDGLLDEDTTGGVIGREE
jgi:hypothetical protein